jgi:hypothetical protein
MKSWLGVVGRACLEFVIILILLSFAAGASTSVALPTDSLRPVYKYAAEAALGLTPLAALLTLFLAFFSFEFRLRSRVAAWLGLLCLGAMLFSFGIGLRRVPLIHDAATPPKASRAALRLIPAAVAFQQRRAMLWTGAYEGSDALDAVAVDFGSDFPRLAYAHRAALDPKSGEVEIQGRTYSFSLPTPRPVSLVPESSLFAGSWIWDRLASMDEAPLSLVFAVVGGFLLLAIGFRFLCRVTSWPLANVFLAAAGMAGLAILDASLSGPAPLSFFNLLAKRAGLPMGGPLLLASIEGAFGLLLGVIDVATAPRSGRGRNA